MIKTKTKKIVFSLIIIIIFIFSIIGYISLSLIGKIKKMEISKNNTDLGINTEENKEEVKNTGITNILFFGLDRRNPDENSRTDCIMIISIDNDKKVVKATSLMRDMYVPIPGKGSNRINAAYAFGGPALAIKTINSNFGLNIEKFVTVDFLGLEKLIDTIGGVTINVTSDEAKVLNMYLKELNRLNNNTVPDVNAGVNTLNGRQAVAYARIRYVGNGDYERTERQREVLNQIFKKLKAQGIIKLTSTISEMLPYVETNLSNKEILSLSLDAAKFDTNNIIQFRIPADGTFKSENIRGMAVLVPNLNENKKRLKEFIYGAQ
ncbi:LCP family protein [Caloramator sp. E03]|uniref:LCP family protein n=1 Tax=Caloramator sp. E03 TaxID=2576307 RepID=UPI00143D1FED|nr:LCP family protein [Caloramator sp. E03]